MSAPMSPRYQLPDDFFSPPSSPPRTGGYEVTEFPPREEYAVEIFDAPRKRVTSMSERTTAALEKIAPAEYRDRFVTATPYYVGGEKRTTFQLRSWNGDKYVTRVISAVTAKQMNDDYPGIVVKKKKKQYSISGGFRDGVELPRKTGLEVEFHSRGRVAATRATLIPTKEFKYVASEHGVPPKVINSIIRDVDAIAYEELDAAEHGRLKERPGYYKIKGARRYAVGSAQDIAAKEKAKRRRAEIKEEYGSAKEYKRRKEAASLRFY